MNCDQHILKQKVACDRPPYFCNTWILAATFLTEEILTVGYTTSLAGPNLQPGNQNFEVMQFTKPKGERGRRAVHEGYQYTQHRAGDGDKWSQWHCIRRTCHGRIKISSTETEHVQVSEHDHLPNFGDAKASLAVAGMKRRAEREINMAPLHLTQAVLSNCDSETLIQMPKERTMNKAIQRVRREAQPSLPKTLADLEEVPEMYSRIDTKMMHGRRVG